MRSREKDREKRILEGLSHRRKPLSEVTKKKLSAINKGKCLSEEHKKRISEANKGRKASDEIREKLSKAHKGVKLSEERRKKCSERAFILWQDPEFIRKQKEAHKGFVPLEEDKRRRLETLKKIRQSPEYRGKLSASFKKRWQDPEFAAKMGRAWRVHPTKPEKLLLNLLDELYPGQWKYTGDFSFTISGKCPDFVNCNGQKKMIELFGDYWHRGENPEDRIKEFKEFGYETLVIWEGELKDIKAVEEKIIEFA